MSKSKAAKRTNGRTFPNVIISSIGLTVTCTDAKSSMWPSDSPIKDRNGYIVCFQRTTGHDRKCNLYATKVGEVLARALEDGSDKKITNRKLALLPQGYALFDRLRKVENGEITRRDTYLFGSPCSSKFCSPHEFEEHLLWLASDKFIACHCKYCISNREKGLPSPVTRIVSQEEDDSTPMIIQAEDGASNDNASAPLEANFDAPTDERHNSDSSYSSGKQNFDSSSDDHAESDISDTDEIHEILSSPCLTSDSEGSECHMYSKNMYDFSEETSSEGELSSSSTSSNLDELVQARLRNVEERLSKRLDSDDSLLCLDVCQESKYYEKMYRRNEIVWVDIRRVWNQPVKCAESLLTHWPALIRSRERNARDKFILYKVMIYSLNNHKILRQKAILPWRALNPNKFLSTFENAARSKDLVSKFIQALDSVKVRSSMCCAMDSYYLFSSSSRRKNSSNLEYSQEIGQSEHYKSIIFGPEVLREGDILLLDSEKIDVDRDDNDDRNNDTVLFKVHYFYYFKRRNRIEMTGDMYRHFKLIERSNTLALKKIEMAQNLSVVGLDEVIGRFYKYDQDINRPAPLHSPDSANVLFC
ncbi:1400_t:CDS:2 [Acaulospora morrowiae]|uniref:1400_t:CDS:1 n=1 Tax=Acaulospora morrowiae TaxID=94023 RepID=A0A9N8ZJU0_9GLOM|nr:1400_t:CDS:2 [Acaulospora morrowiae]